MSVKFSKIAALVAHAAVLSCTVTACDDTTPTFPPAVAIDPAPGLAPELAPPDVEPQSVAPSALVPDLSPAPAPAEIAPVMLDPATDPATCVPQPETCNAVDDDCDGGIDEGLRNACGECGPALVELCNGADDDCDGIVDEDAAGVGADCTAGLGACHQTGLTSCDDGALRCVVGAVIEPSPERCDAIDNDCDGSADEGLGLGETCTVGRGACEATGVQICDARTTDVICAADPGPAAPEVCDGTDNDCDGATDEQVDVEGACVAALGALCQQDGAMVCGARGPACSARMPTAGDCAQARPTTIDANDRFACAVTEDAQVKCWGDVRFLGGELVGDDVNEMGGQLMPIDLDMQVRSIAIGGDFACALGLDDQVKCWGQNAVGQLGQGDRLARGNDHKAMGSSLLPIDLDMRVAQVVAGADFACALDDAGVVKCWGGNMHGRLGQGDGVARGDAAHELGGNLPAVDLGDFMPIKLTAGDAHVCALNAQGKVACWGANDHLQLSEAGRDNHRGDAAEEMGAQLPRVRLRADIVDISAGPNQTCAVSDRGSVQCWGAAYGAEPVGLNLHGHDAVRIDAGAQTCILDNAGTVVCWGMIDGIEAIDDPGLPGTIHRVVLPRPTLELTASPAMNCALDVDGALRCWGRNEVGQLGQGDTHDRTAADVFDVPVVFLGDEQL